LNYVTGSITGGGVSSATTSYPPRDIVRWNSIIIPAGASQTVSYEATPALGVCISQPLFINRAWVTTDVTRFATNDTYHQGAGAGYVTFLSGLGGSIYNAEIQAVDYRMSPRSGVVIVPDEGYCFTG
jgi:hypothetical protein